MAYAIFMVPRDTRRCKDYSVQSSMGSIKTWTNLAMDGNTDRLEVRQVTWATSANHKDTLSAKGLVKTEQLLGLEDGRDAWEAVADLIRERSGTPPTGTSATAAVSYDFLAQTRFEVTVDYRAT